VNPVHIPTGDRRYLTLLRGQHWDGHSLARHGAMWNDCLLQSLVGDAGYTLLIFIYDGTRSALVRPGCVMTSPRDTCDYAPHKRDRRRCAL
jgi:hypothetical protein